ncbi:uncharacterized protein ACJ7VT_002591 [Polymixia lowei]
MKRNTASASEEAVMGERKRPRVQPEKYIPFVKRNKTLLSDILFDFRFILSKTYEEDLLTQREYNNLVQMTSTDLLDLLLNKGEGSCKSFVRLLQLDKEVKETFPRLCDIPWYQLDRTTHPEPEPHPCSTQRPTTADPRRRNPRFTPSETTNIVSIHTVPKREVNVLNGVKLWEELVTCPKSHILKRRRGATVHCGECNIRYKPEAMRRILSGRLSIKCSQQPLEVQDCHIRKLLGDELVDSTKTITFLEKALLLKIDKIYVTFDQDNILHVEVVNICKIKH